MLACFSHIVSLISLKEDNLLVVSHGFTDLSLLSERRTTTNNINTIQNFLRNKSLQNCRFVLYVQTHAYPVDGGLFYSPSKPVGLLVVCFFIHLMRCHWVELLVVPDSCSWNDTSWTIHKPCSADKCMWVSVQQGPEWGGGIRVRLLIATYVLNVAHSSCV